MRKLLLAFLIAVTAGTALWGKKTQVEPSYAWTLMPPLGLRQPAGIDTVMVNMARNAVPSENASPAWATTGNYGAEGLNMLYFEREPISEFFFNDALSFYLPSQRKQKFYNTRIPMSLVSYGTGGGRDAGQERFSTIFSGNINARAQVGGLVDYIYSKGSYNNQADKNFMWGLSGSYIGDRYEMQAYMNFWNTTLKENGGITDDNYIFDPASLQGGSTKVETKSIPTRLNGAHSQLTGADIYVNNRYKVGYWEEEEVNDTTTKRTFVPVSSFIWTINYRKGHHMFIDNNAADNEFWEHSYFTRERTEDHTRHWALRNTVGISMIEGFHRLAKFGLAAYLTHEVRRFTQGTDSIPLNPDGLLTPYPYDTPIVSHATENPVWVGGQLTKQKGSLLRYDATAEFGLLGPVVGDVKLEGNISTRIPLFGDTMTVSGFGHFSNTEAPYLMKHYVSNHFIWNNNFGKTRRTRFGGTIDLPQSHTRITAGVENIQNLIYFNSNSMPTQHGDNIQIFSASLNQDLRYRALNWENRVIYQTSSNASVLPLPSLTVYSNLYVLFKVAKVLHVQLGVDCDYYTSYRAMDYQPATMSFTNRATSDIKVGNYPFMNAYINMKLSKARFYLLFQHVNQGMFGGSNYFSAAHYPLNPRRFLMGISIDFAN